MEAKQRQIAALLESIECDHLLLLEVANMNWFTGAPLARGAFEPTEQPAIMIAAKQRWLVCSSIDSQRLFQLFLDDLGFQLKEWQWHQPRDLLLGELCQGRVLASDRLIRDCKSVGEAIKKMRRVLSPWDQSRLLSLGETLSHSLEATARNFETTDSEEEIAGQLAHRLVRRGAEIVHVFAAADGRIENDRRPGVAGGPVSRFVTLGAFVRRDGLHAAACRTVWLEPPPEVFRSHYDAATRIAAARLAETRAGQSAEVAWEAGRRQAVGLGFEHEWRHGPAPFRIAWLPVEQILPPNASESFELGHAVVWPTQIGSALLIDTALVGADRPVLATRSSEWPVRRVHGPGGAIDLPDILVRG